MKVLILWGLFILSASAAPKGKGSVKESTKEEVILLSNVEVVLACTKGTTLREQYEKAFNECDKELGQLNRQAGKGKGKTGKGKGKTGKGKEGKGNSGKGKGGKGKGKSGKGKAGKGKGGRKCPSVDDILSKLRAKAEKDTCVFHSLGWVDEDGKVINDVMENAIKSLPAEVARQMSQLSIETCTNDKAKEWSQRPRRQRCDPTYSIPDRDGLTKYEANVAGMKCLKTVISTSCRSFISKPVSAETIPLPISSGNNGPKPIVNGPGGSGGSSSIEEAGGLQAETIPIPIGVNPETVPLPISPGWGEVGSSEVGGSSEESGSSEVGGSSEEGGSPEEGGSSEEGGSLEEGGPLEEGGSSEDGGYSNGGGSSPNGHGGHENAVVGPFQIGGGGLFGQGGPGPFPSGGGPFPIFPSSFLPGFGPIPSQGGPGNFQQVIVESPQAPPPYFQPPSQSFPERWPSNLVAALVPADWAAENFSFQFGHTYEEYDYEYGEYEYEEYDYEYEEYEYEYEEYDYADYDDGNNTTDYYGDEYGGNNDYAEDDADTVGETVPEETPVAIAVPLPLDLNDEGEDEALKEATDAKTEAPTDV